MRQQEKVRIREGMRTFFCVERERARLYMHNPLRALCLWYYFTFIDTSAFTSKARGHGKVRLEVKSLMVQS